MEWINQIIQNFTRLFQWWVIIMPWELGIRVRLGKNQTLLTPGTHFRIPLLDSVYIQTTRLRVISMAPCTVTSRDNQTITFVACLGYSIIDIEKLYDTLYQPERTVSNIALSGISDYISTNDRADCTPRKIQEALEIKLGALSYGLKFDYIRITGYAIVKTFRLIQDQHWEAEGFKTDNKQ